jgi:hypothetical protein
MRWLATLRVGWLAFGPKAMMAKIWYGAARQLRGLHHGLATAICVMAGSKYWVVMRSKTSEVVENGNLRSTRAFPQNFYKNSGKGLWEAEGIHLVQGDVL